MILNSILRKFLYKNLSCTFFLLITINCTYAQFHIGPKICFGDGQFASSNFSKNLNYQNQINSNIQIWDSKNHLGLFYGAGLFIEYKLSYNISYVAELSFNNLNSKVKIEYSRSGMNGSGNMEMVEVNSIAKIKTNFLSLPLLLKINVFGPYILTGIRANYIINSKINSNEIRKTFQYYSGVQTQISEEEMIVTSSLDKERKLGLNLVFGLGKSFIIKDKKISIDIRYNLSLTKTELYSSETELAARTFENDQLFFSQGKNQADQAAPQYKLNDFKMGFMEVSFNYNLYYRLKKISL